MAINDHRQYIDEKLKDDILNRVAPCTAYAPSLFFPTGEGVAHSATRSATGTVFGAMAVAPNAHLAGVHDCAKITFYRDAHGPAPVTNLAITKIAGLYSCSRI